MKKVISSLLVGAIALSVYASKFSLENVAADENTTTTSEVLNEEETLNPFIGVWTNEEGNEITLTTQKMFVDGWVHKVETLEIDDSEAMKVASIEFEESEELESQEMTYSSTADQLSYMGREYEREVNANIVNYVKDQLSTLEPVNLEQLLEVDENYLMAAYYQAQEDFDEKEDPIHAIYLALSQDYAELELLTEEDYEDYLVLAEDLEDTTYTFAELNKALPRTILENYRQLKEDEEKNETLVKDQLKKMIDEAIKAYEERKAESSEVYLEDNEWPEKEEVTTADNTAANNTAADKTQDDPHLLKESEYEVRDGKFSQEEAYTILVKVTGLPVDYNTGYAIAGGYKFPVDGVKYFVVGDGEINTSEGDVFNRNEESRLARVNEANTTPTPSYMDLFPDWFDIYPENAVIKPFFPDIAYNYLLGKEDFPADAYMFDFEFNDDGSYTLTIASRDKIVDPNISEKDAIIDVFVVYADGTYYKK
ncbi:hypothetical protein [Facklamia sp. 7083-14-GEN3]|uniref:hypothetical protein n=1 Tax=Facklamia sp. 7083-14-GEN3 TaxID=2973478 RepID=UPI00215CF9B1|nr:hypothetical protein [Facklamia sp. 7083-14-GEN3]MCR8968437.1 hypothetical protein [Facklamia sp. 7083-14-GEN3]